MEIRTMSHERNGTRLNPQRRRSSQSIQSKTPFGRVLIKKIVHEPPPSQPFQGA